MKLVPWILPVCLLQTAAYKDARYGFSIEPPAFPAAAGGHATPVMFFAPPEEGFAANLNVMVQSTDLGARDYADVSRGQFAQMNFKINSEKELTVSGRGAFLWDYQGRTQGRELRWLALAVVDQGRVFLVTCTATPDGFLKHEKAFRAALASFSLP